MIVIYWDSGLQLLRVTEHPLYNFGENVTRIETKINPKRITSSGHQLSNQEPDSVDELIALPSLTTSKTACEITSSNPNRESR